jgi:hypothetical protein
VTRAAQKRKLVRDLAIIFAGIVIGIFIAWTNSAGQILAATKGTIIIGSLLAGAFFVSLFTAVPAAIVLVELMAVNSFWEVAWWAAIGAMIGDLLIFMFVEDSLNEDVKYLANKIKRRRIRLFHSKSLRWLMPIIGAVTVASPFPDELGISMMGLSKMPLVFFIPISLTLNFLGILALGLFVGR